MSRGALAGALFLVSAAAAAGHGVVVAPVDGARAVVFRYEDGTPLADAEANVYGPGDAEAAWEGFADMEGRVAFVPDREGVWRVVVDDGLGHRAEARIEVDAAGGIATAPTGRRAGPSAIAAGLGVLFGFFGLWALARAAALRKAG